MIKSLPRFALLALAAMMPSLAFAQMPPPPDAPIDANIRKETVETLAKEMEASYVYAEKGKQVAADLRARLAKGEYDKLDRAQAFAKTLTEQIQAPTSDKHLRVYFSERDFNVPQARREPTPAEVDEQRAFLRSINFGVEKVERLMGNIGYLDLRGFSAAGLAATPSSRP